MTEGCCLGMHGTIPGLSDHLGTFAEITKRDKKPPTIVNCRSYKNYDKQKAGILYQQMMEKSNFRENLNTRDLDAAMATWLETTAKVCDEIAPPKTFTKREDIKFIPWYTQEIIDLTNSKQAFLREYRRCYRPEIEDNNQTN